jgi:hypothetical protein
MTELERLNHEVSDLREEQMARAYQLMTSTAPDLE